MNPAMWKIHLRNSEGVAIRSTFGRLKRSLSAAEASIFIGTVRYVDYDTAVIPDDNLLWPYLHKRLSLEFERELRAIVGLGEVERDSVTGELPLGLNLPVGLDELVEGI
jgi:hypothetical protein